MIGRAPGADNVYRVSWKMNDRQFSGVAVVDAQGRLVLGGDVLLGDADDYKSKIHITPSKKAIDPLVAS